MQLLYWSAPYDESILTFPSALSGCPFFLLHLQIMHKQINRSVAQNSPSANLTRILMSETIMVNPKKRNQPELIIGPEIGRVFFGFQVLENIPPRFPSSFSP